MRGAAEGYGLRPSPRAGLICIVDCDLKEQDFLVYFSASRLDSIKSFETADGEMATSSQGQAEGAEICKVPCSLLDTRYASDLHCVHVCRPDKETSSSFQGTSPGLSPAIGPQFATQTRQLTCNCALLSAIPLNHHYHFSHNRKQNRIR